MKTLENQQANGCLIQLDTKKPIIRFDAATKKQADLRAKVKVKAIMQLIQESQNSWDLVEEIITDLVRDMYLMDNSKKI